MKQKLSSMDARTRTWWYTKIRFAASVESNASDEFKELYVKAKKEDEAHYSFFFMIFLNKRINDITKAKPINPKTMTESKSTEKVGAEKKLAAEPAKSFIVNNNSVNAINTMVSSPK